MKSSSDQCGVNNSLYMAYTDHHEKEDVLQQYQLFHKIYRYLERERERERGGGRGQGQVTIKRINKSQNKRTFITNLQYQAALAKLIQIELQIKNT